MLGGDRKPIDTQDCQSPTGKKFQRIFNFDSWAKKHDEIKGIYVVWNCNNKSYVGQSENIGNRWREHRSALLRKGHANQELQKDWFQMGADAFRFDILEENPSDIDASEAFYINKLDSYLSGYNQTPDGKPIDDYTQNGKSDWNQNVTQQHGFIYGVDINDASSVNNLMAGIQREGIIYETFQSEGENYKDTSKPANGPTQLIIDKQATAHFSTTGLKPTTKVHGLLPPIGFYPEDDLSIWGGGNVESEKEPIKTGETIHQPTDGGIGTAPLKPHDPPSPKPPLPGPPPIGENSMHGLWYLLIFILIILIFVFGRDCNRKPQLVKPKPPIEQYEHYYQTHTVKKGESLSLIAGLYRVDLEELIQINGIKDRELINVGMQVKIPRP